MHNYLMRYGAVEPKRVYTLNVFVRRDDVNEFLQNTLPDSDYKAEIIEWMVSDLDYNGYIHSNNQRLGARLIVFLGASR